MFIVTWGFYKDLEKLRQGGMENADFRFLRHVPVSHSRSVHDFLHGQCDDFAAALSDCYGYRIEHLLDRCGGLIHAYCVKDLPSGETAFIDARGITTDEAVFFSEFSKWCTYQNGNIWTDIGPCQIHCYRNSREMYHDGYRCRDTARELYRYMEGNRSLYDVRDFQREAFQEGSVDRLIEAAVEKYKKVVAVFRIKDVNQEIEKC